MRAVLCKKMGPTPELEVVDLPEPAVGVGMVKVKIKKIGVNYPDLLMAQGKYQIAPEGQFIPGIEAAGIIEAIGDQVEGLSEGQEVIVYADWGTYAEKIVVEAWRCIPKPGDVSFDVAAAFMMTYGTAYHALQDRGNIQPGETLLVLGASGGVGTAAVELGNQMGATVLAATSDPGKRKWCQDAGADEVIYYSEEFRKAVKSALKTRSLDVIVDPIGGPVAEQAMRELGWNGRHLIIGFASGQIPAVKLNLPLLKGLSLIGVYWNGFDRHQHKKHISNLLTLLDFIREGKIKPKIGKQFELSEVSEALDALRQGRIKGKIILST